MAMLYAGHSEISWAVRETLTECDTYKCAYQKLTTEKIDALGYLILAGTKKDEGVVISRDRDGTAHVDHLNATDGKWFLV